MEKLKLVELCASLLKFKVELCAAFKAALAWLLCFGPWIVSQQIYFCPGKHAVFYVSLFLQWDKTFFFYNSSIDRLDLMFIKYFVIISENSSTEHKTNELIWNSSP